MTLNCKLFLQKIQFLCATGSKFAFENNFTNNKRAISWFFGTVTPTTQPKFYLFKVNNRNTKNNRVRCELCLKLTVMTLERRQ